MRLADLSKLDQLQNPTDEHRFKEQLRQAKKQEYKNPKEKSFTARATLTSGCFVTQ